MKYKNILLTGGSGKLGQAIIGSKYFSTLLTPSRKILDITKPETIEKLFNNNPIDALIHCAALARMEQCEENPVKALKINIMGTSNLIAEVIRQEKKLKKKIRFIYISTDGVYPGTSGNYSEKDPAIPYNRYGWTKLGAECSVNLLTDFCIIRTSFFDPRNIRFESSSTDAYSSKMTIDSLVKAIAEILENDFVGTINIGSERKSDYKRYREFKPQLKPCKYQDIRKRVPFMLAKDSSLDFSLWKKMGMRKKKEK